MQRTLIWDLPTRLFHWTLALSFAGAWLTSDGDQWRALHVFLGYLMLGLVGFRMLWGFAGSHFSRFASFWFGPKEALDYLKQVAAGHAQRHVGHNPTGSLAIYLLLALVVAIGVTGILTLGGDEQQGIAAGWFSFSQIGLLKQLHEALAILTLVLVIGHIAGVVVESVQHKENLARSMVTGIKLADAATPTAKPHAGVALLLLALIAGFALWWFDYALDRQLESLPARVESSAERDEPRVKFVGRQLPDNARWREECGSCHGVFYPALLPARSWQKMMAEQHQHFGTDLGLDGDVTQALLTFLTENSAEQHRTEAAFKIEQSIPKEVTPLRITETPYWVKKHHEIAATDWASALVMSKSNCAACHSDAGGGTFEDGAMQIPRSPASKR